MSPNEWWLLYDINVGQQVADKRQAMDRLKRIYFDHREQETKRDSDSV